MVSVSMCREYYVMGMCKGVKCLMQVVEVGSETRFYMPDTMCNFKIILYPPSPPPPISP